MISAKALIEQLTNDEDSRQELWLHYVSGHPINSLTEKLAKVEQERLLQDKFQDAIREIYKSPPTDGTIDFLGNFSDFERSIMFLLLLGFSVREVSEYKGISNVRIEQCIVAIRNHSAWENYGIKENL